MEYNTLMESSVGKLIIIRHTESEWNKLGIWTGSRDVHLSEDGFKTSEKIGNLIDGIPIDEAIISTQIRTYETLLGIEKVLGDFDIPVTCSGAINERDYGLYTCQDKHKIEKEVGEEKFCAIRRGWDCHIPGGETLKMVYERVVPFYIKEVIPRVLLGKNILLISHGNAIRAMIKYIENISDKDIEETEMPFDEVYIYDIDNDGKSLHKEVLTVAEKK